MSDDESYEEAQARIDGQARKEERWTCEDCGGYIPRAFMCGARCVNCTGKRAEAAEARADRLAAALAIYVDRCAVCKGSGKYWNNLIDEARPCPDCTEARAALAAAV